MRRVLLGLFGVVAVVGLMLPGIATPVAAMGEKVTICHFPGHEFDFEVTEEVSETVEACIEGGGNPITVSENAVKAHIRVP